MVNYASLGYKEWLEEVFPGSAYVGVNFRHCGCLTSNSELRTRGNNKEANCLMKSKLGV